jgi:pyridoxal phosphate enzyme (YggS family)
MMTISSSLSEQNRKLKLLMVSKERSAIEVQDHFLRLRQQLDDRIVLMGLAENRLDEAEAKFKRLKTFIEAEHIEKHFIGRLQSRKIKKIVECFDVIQSLDTLKHAKLINELSTPVKVMIQVNISDEPQKGGVHPSEFKQLKSEIQKLEHIELIGVMGMASQSDEQTVLQQFQLLKSLQEELEECSMGMSADYQIAIGAGTSMLRIGRKLFSENPTIMLKSE